MRLIIGFILLILLAAAGYFTYRHFSHRVTTENVVKDNYARRGQIMLESEESVSRGMAFLQQNDAKSAIFEFEDALRIDSTNYRAYYNLGILYRLMGDWEHAEGFYRTALSWAPRFYAAKNNLANILMGRHAPLDSVLFYIDDCVKAYPDCTDYVDTKIDALVSAGKLSDAEPIWRKAFAKDSSHVGLLNKKPLFDAKRRKP